MAYYLAKSNQTFIFEDNQRDLELATENLSGLLEQPITQEKCLELKQQVLDKSSYVNARVDVLLKDTVHGLQENRWEWRSDA